MCIYKKAYSQVNTRKIFWDYIHAVHMSCNSKINEECSKNEGFRVVNDLDWDDIQKCVEDSFSAPKHDWYKTSTTNKLIDQDIAYWKKFGSSLVPSIVINNSTYRG